MSVYALPAEAAEARKGVRSPETGVQVTVSHYVNTGNGAGAASAPNS